MKKVIYILLAVSLFSCEYENPTPQGQVIGNESNPTITPVAGSKNVKAHIENDKTYTVNGGLILLGFNNFTTGDAFNSTDGWYSPTVNDQYLYVAKSDVTVNIRLHAYVKHTAASFEIYIRNKTKDKYLKTLSVINNPNWSGLVDLTANNIQLSAGDKIGIYTGLGSGTLTLYPNGSAFGSPSDYSYFYVEAQ